MRLSLLRLLFFVFSLAASSSAFAATKTVLIMGDSLSAGYGIAQQSAWPVIIGQRITQAKIPYAVANASISGETTAGGRSRIDAELARHKPAVVVIELGANDGLRGLSLKQMRDNLDMMVKASQKAGARVMLIGMQMPPNFGQSYTQKFRDTFSDLAKEHKTALLPFLMEGFAEKRELFQADGIHPTAEAQKTIADNVWPVLRPLLK